MTTVGNGTTLTVTSGQIVQGALVLEGGFLRVLAGGTIIDTINNIGYDLIEAGGAAIGTIATGTVSITSFGWATTPGTEYVAFGGISTGAALQAAHQDLYGRAINTSVGWDSIQWVFSGGIATGTTLTGGVEIVSGIPLQADATQLVFAGGNATDTTINAFGLMIVESDAVAVNTTLNGGLALVAGQINGATINNGVLSVSGTGTATTINDGGILSDDGGTIVDTQINGGGLANINSGTLQGTTAINDGTLELHAGAVANGPIAFVGSSGTLTLDDPISLNTIISRFDTSDKLKLAANHLDAGGYSPRFDNGGSLILDSTDLLHIIENGVIYDLRFNPLEDFSGKAFELVPDSDGVDVVVGNLASIPSGQTVSSDQVGSTQVGSSNIQNVFGSAIAATIHGGGYQNVESGGSATSTIIRNGGVQEVLGGGVDIGATIAGGSQVILLGGTTSGTTTNSGVQTVYGTSHQATVNSGRIVVNFGGTTTDAILNNGGFEFVQYGGTAISTTVNGGGFLGTDGGGAMFGTIINSGGIANVPSSEITNPTINGGTLILHSDSTVDGAIHIAASASTLELIDADPTTTTSQFDGSTLTVSSTGTTYQFQIAGANGSTLNVRPGKFGGTDFVFDLPTNHPPEVSGAIVSSKSEDDPAYTVDLLQFSSDPDDDVLHVAIVAGLATGVTLDGDTLHVDPNAYDSLAVGEHATITVSYNVVDGNGGSVAQTATITINGANDAPTSLSRNVSVNDRSTVSARATDPDVHDHLSVVAASFAGHSVGISSGPFTIVYGKYGELFPVS